MRDWNGKRYWLVGASEGLGAALAKKLSAAGAEVILSARSEDRLKDLVAKMPGKAQAVACDVADPASGSTGRCPRRTGTPRRSRRCSTST